MSNLEDIRAFVEVVETGGFSRAASRLGVSKSIVSRRIAKLEVDLGARLLHRTTRGVAATEAGVAYKAHAERALAELEAAREAATESRQDIVGRLRLSVPLSFGLRHVAPVLAQFALDHPRLEIDAAYSDRFVDLVGERFDMAIRLGDLPDSTLAARRIAPIHAALVASPAYLARRGRPQTPEDLTGHDALVQTSVREASWRFTKGRRTHLFHPQGRIRTDNGEALLQAATAGVGLALLPTFLAADEIEAGRLERLLPDYELPTAGFYVVRPPGPHAPARVRALTDLLVARFGGEPYWDACAMRSRSEAAAPAN